MEISPPRHYSVYDYLIYQPHLIAQRIKEDTLNLSGLHLTNLNGLELIPGISKIIHLDLSNNQLSSIPNNAFYFMPEVEIIDLSHNKISTIDPLAFKNLSMLMKLHLSNNNLTSVGVWLARLFQLRRLDLTFNSIATIAPNAFRDLPYLEELYLDHNKLSSLLYDDFKPLKSLNRIDLAENLLDINEEKEQKLEDALPSHAIIILD